MVESRFSVCPHDCPDSCAWRVKIEKGKITGIDGDPEHPVTQGVICAKAKHYPERVYSPDRILYPMKHQGPKGSGQFVRISWDEALNEITKRWQMLIRNHGAESILPYSYAGTEGYINKASMDRRFFYHLGSTQLERTICSAAGDEGYNLAYGGSKGINPINSTHAQLIVFWGINALETNLHQALLAQKARQNGAKIISIDVHYNRTAHWADDFFHILPGSDGALALGIAHIIFRDQLYSPWGKDYSLGWDEYAVQVQKYTPEFVASITGLTPERIEELAHIYALTRPSLIRIGNGLQHHENGGASTWAIACLPALTGAWQDLGGGAIKFNGGYFPLNKKAVQRPDLLKGNPRTVNMNQLGQVLTALDPPVYSLYVYNSNPAVVAPNQELVIKGLTREDLFTVVHEQVWTDTARWADIVLPATTHLEHQDLYISYWHCVLQWAEPVIPRLGESKPNIEVFQALAAKMGFEDPCFRDTAEDIAVQALDTAYWREVGINFERLRKENYIALPVPEIPFALGGFPTTTGKIELKNERASRMGIEPVPQHYPLHEGPENKQSEFPLTLISPPNHSFLNSTFANLTELKIESGEPTIEIHPQDALKRSIQSGDLVKVFNSRGECLLKAVVSESVLPGVVVATGVWWLSSYKNGKGINSLTSDRLSDIGHGATFFSNLVKINKA